MVLIFLMAPINQIKKHKKSAVITVLWERQSAAQLRIPNSPLNPKLSDFLASAEREAILSVFLSMSALTSLTESVMRSPESVISFILLVDTIRHCA